MAQNPASTSSRAADELQLILDNVPGLVFTLTPKGEIDFASRALLEHLGRIQSDVRSWPVRDAIHPDDLSNALSEWARASDTQLACEFELRLRRADSTYGWFRCRIAPSRTASGDAQRWFGLLTDIDSFKREAEASRMHVRYLREFIDRIPGLVYTMTPDCQLEEVNGKVLEYFGRTFEDLKDWDAIGCVHPQDMPRVLESLRRTVEFGEPHEVAQRLRRADGAFRWFQPRGLSLRDSEGRILRWYCLLLDIDDLKRAEEGLRHAQARLSRATQLATVSELAAAIAHEVNQPLAAVIANAHACQRWLTPELLDIERASRSAGRLVRNGNDAADIVQRIRKLFSHVRSDKSALNMSIVIQEACHLMTDELRARGVTLEVDMPGEGARTMGDQLQLLQVLTNVMRNAIEAMDGVTDRQKLLTVHLQERDGEIIVEVSDQGVGIGDAEGLFESFYTTKEHGMGMGLAICRSIIEAHEGRIWAVRNPVHGSTFGFALKADARE